MPVIGGGNKRRVVGIYVERFDCHHTDRFDSGGKAGQVVAGGLIRNLWQDCCSWEVVESFLSVPPEPRPRVRRDFFVLLCWFANSGEALVDVGIKLE